MKRSLWYSALVFIAGALFCYLTLQWSLLEVNLEIHVPEFLATIGAAASGFYIASTIQKRTNQAQNRYQLIATKLDTLWTGYNSFSERFKYGGTIPLSAVTQYYKQFSGGLSFLKNLLQAYGIRQEPVLELEHEMDALESYLTDLPMSRNNIKTEVETVEINIRLNRVHNLFAAVLKQIHGE